MSRADDERIAQQKARQALKKKDPSELGFLGEDVDERAGVFVGAYNRAIDDGLEPAAAFERAKTKTGIDPARRALDELGRVSAPFAAWLAGNGGGSILPHEPGATSLEGAVWLELFSGEISRWAATECAREWNRGDFVRAQQALQRALRLHEVSP